MSDDNTTTPKQPLRRRIVTANDGAQVEISEPAAPVTIDDVKRAREDARVAILLAIDRFHVATGLHIDGVEVEESDVFLMIDIPE